jgi:hypothetical protein
MRSRKSRGTTKYICRGWKTCQYALGKPNESGKGCLYGSPYLPQTYNMLGGYKPSLGCPQCTGIKITPEIELQIKIQLL